MAGVEALPKEYGYVAIVLALYSALNSWMTFQVGKARAKYNVRYPAMYASEEDGNEKGKIFNCVQRAHQNSVENMSVFFMLMMVGGIRHPLVCALLGALYTVARYVYFVRYSSGVPEKRRAPWYFIVLVTFGLMISTISCGVNLIITSP
ncbi:unnamed protein product [Cuscuta campestris]|uniref:Glutathione S-transferase 3, mitochondrial n=1 Tax=Cuscuta campestris TaxID=132261 RepID=A0A484LZI3_9ASTE|nr:unnamed protein product [Cuscuta campestris]